MERTREIIGWCAGVSAVLMLWFTLPGCSGGGESGGGGTGDSGEAAFDADGGATGGGDGGATDGSDTGGTDDTGGTGGMDLDTGGSGAMDAENGGGDADRDTLSSSDAGELGADTAGGGADTSGGGTDTGSDPRFQTVDCTNVSPAANVQVGPRYSYQPSRVTVKTGEVIRWNWASSVTLRHNVTGDDDRSCASAKPNWFQSRTTAAAGFTFCVEFNAAGQWEYHCTVGNHCSRGMKGTVVVNN